MTGTNNDSNPKSVDTGNTSATQIEGDLVWLGEIPKFRGNLEAHETASTKGHLDVRVFLRALENHFSRKNITTDKEKLEILFARIDKTVGNAVRIIDSYAGLPDITFEKVKKNLLKIYPQFNTTELPQASYGFSQLRVDKPCIFSGIHKVEVSARAVVDAFVNSGNTKKLNITGDTMIHLDDTKRIRLKPFLQKAFMHYILSAQLDPDVYKKIAHIGNDTDCVDLMSLAVEEAEKCMSLKKGKSRAVETPEVLYAIQTPQGEYSAQITCYQCGKKGHMKRECTTSKYCHYCRMKGHTTLACNKRKRTNTPYCEQCNRLNHDTKSCKRKTCETCGKGGHTSENCYVRKKSLAQTNAQAQMTSDKRGHVRYLELEDPDIDSSSDEQNEH